MYSSSAAGATSAPAEQSLSRVNYATEMAVCRPLSVVAPSLADLDIFAANGIAHDLDPISAALLTTTSSLTRAVFADHGFLVRLGDFDGAVGEVGIA